MVAPVILVEASPRRVADGVAQAVRLAGAGAEKPYRYPDAAGGADQDWRAGIVSLPTIICALDFDGTDLGTGAVPQAAEIVWAPARSADLDALAAYFWFDAAIKVRVGPEGASPPVILAGKVLNALVVDGQLRLQLADPAASLKKPLPTTRYAGTGGLEGPVEWTGKLKDRVWGRVWNKGGEPIDKAYNIYAFADPSRPLQSIDAVRDKGAAAASLTTVAWQGSAAATLAALRAAVAPQGGGVTCPSLACVKWWTQPAGDLTADLKGEVGPGYVETAPEIASALVAGLTGPAFAAGTVAAAKIARPAPVGWVVDDDSTTVAAMLDQLLGNVSLLWILSPAGEIVLRQWVWGASVAAAKSQKVTRNSTMRPVHTRKIGYQRNELPMARGDLAAIVLASDATYLDGTPIEALKPAQAGADITGTHTAAAIVGQAPTATSSDFAAVTGATKPEPNATAGATVGSDVKKPGGTIYTQVQLETGLGIAAGIAGQGSFATVSSVAYGSSFLTGFGALAARAKIALGDGFVFRADGVTGLSDALAVTSLGTAAAIAGQGAFATMSFAPYSYVREALATAALPTYAKVEGASIVRLLGGDDYNACAIGRAQFNGSAFVEQDIITDYYNMVALDSDNTTTGFATQDWVVHFLASIGNVRIYVNGVTVFNTTFPALAGISGRIGLYYTGTRIIVRVGNFEAYNASAAAGLQLYPKWWAYRTAAVVTNIGAGSFPEGARLGSTLYLANGTTIATDSGLVTSLGTAAAIVGQAPAATDANIEAAADVTKTVSGPGAVVLNYDSAGTLTTPLPKTINDFALTPAGGSAYTTGVTWTVAIVSGTFAGTSPTMTGTGSGNLVLNSAMTSADALLAVTATRSGKAYPPFPVKVTRSVAAASNTGASSGGTLATDNTLANVTGGSFAAISDNLTVTVGSGGQVALSAASLGLSNATGSGANAVEMKWQRETSPGTWADVGSTATSSPNPSYTVATDRYVDGLITCNATATGLTPSSSQKFRLMARLSSGTTTNSIFVSGSAGAQGS